MIRTVFDRDLVFGTLRNQVMTSVLWHDVTSDKITMAERNELSSSESEGEPLGVKPYRFEPRASTSRKRTQQREAAKDFRSVKESRPANSTDW